MNDDSPANNQGGGWVTGQVILMSACLGFGWLMPGHWPGSWHKLSAGVLVVAGAFFGISGAWVLGRNRTVFPEPRPESVLIEHGIYCLIRHPLYSSVMMLSIAWGLWRESLPALAGAIVMIGFLSAKAANEEQRLSRRFPNYVNYRKRTKRFLPWIV